MDDLSPIGKSIAGTIDGPRDRAVTAAMNAIFGAEIAAETAMMRRVARTAHWQPLRVKRCGCANYLRPAWTRRFAMNETSSPPRCGSLRPVIPRRRDGASDLSSASSRVRGVRKSGIAPEKGRSACDDAYCLHREQCDAFTRRVDDCATSPGLQPNRHRACVRQRRARRRASSPRKAARLPDRVRSPAPCN